MAYSRTELASEAASHAGTGRWGSGATPRRQAFSRSRLSAGVLAAGFAIVDELSRGRCDISDHPRRLSPSSHLYGCQNRATLSGPARRKHGGHPETVELVAPAYLQRTRPVRACRDNSGDPPSSVPFTPPRGGNGFASLTKTGWRAASQRVRPGSPGDFRAYVAKAPAPPPLRFLRRTAARVVDALPP